MTDGRSPQPDLARRKARRTAYIVFYGLIGVFAAAVAVQISHQVFFGPVETAPYATCHEGLRALTAAIDEAREAAPGNDGEDAALARFRAALEPAWDYRDGVAALCRGTAGDASKDRAALDAIERLRYAEEHAVRREAGDLAPRRRRVQAIVERDLEPTPAPPAPSGAPMRP